jgi:hypothetical protein
VRAASTLVATASETSGPPPIDSTHSRTAANPGSEATTAPNPTRLATVSIGNAEALAPASMLSRNYQGTCMEAARAQLLPGALGAHSWQAMAFNPVTGLLYIPAQEIGMTYEPDAA